MQFGQPRQEKFDKRPKCFAPCPKIKIGRCFSEKNEAPQKVPMVTLIAVLTTLPNKSEEKPSSFCSMFENDNGIFLQEEISSQKVPLDLYKAVLKTLPESFGQKSEKFSLTVRNWWWNTFLKNKWLCSKCSYGHGEASCDNTVMKRSTKLREFFGRCLKLIINKHFSEEKYFTKNAFAHEKTVLTAQPKNFPLKAEKLTPTFRKLSKNAFFRNKVSSKNVPMETCIAF